MAKVIKQKSYGDITIDQREPDCVILVVGKGKNCNLIQIERSIIDKFIKAIKND